MSGCHPEQKLPSCKHGLVGYCHECDCKDKGLCIEDEQIKTKKLNEINMDLCSHGRILMMNDCYYCKADKEKLDMLKRVMTLENFVGQNYMRDMDALASRLEDVERGLENYREYETGIEDLETDVMYIKQRLDKLENYMEMEDRITASDIIGRLAEVERFQDITNAQYKVVGKSNNRIEELEKTINQLMDKIAEIGNHYYRERQEPYKCPVCNGSGKDWNRLVSMGTHKGVNRLVPDKCNACKGEGVLWK